MPLNCKVLDFRNFRQEDWFSVKFLRKVVKSLDSCEKVITQNGEHSKIKWESGYQDVLSWHCMSNKKATVIMRSFSKSFDTMKESRDKEKIRQFILRNHMFIGAKKTKFNFENSTISDIADKKFGRRFNRFLNVVSREMGKNNFKSQLANSVANTPMIKDKSAGKVNEEAVAILTCSAGGGHRAVANSISGMLNTHENKKYKATVINIDELSGDHLAEVTQGVVKTFQIFSRFRCQENDDVKADLFCDIRWRLHQFLPQTRLDKVNRAISRIGAKTVINTIHHEVQWVSPSADLGCTTIFMNTDYELPPQLAQLKKNVQSGNLKVFTPIVYPKKIPGMEGIGYPIRPGFEKKATEKEIRNLRKKYGVGKGESLVIVQMGSLAMGVEKSVESLIAHTKRLNNKCHFVFLCARNQKALDGVDRFQTKLHDKIALHPVGMQNDVELGLLYQACDRVLGKPGGATSAEIAATGAYLLAYKPLPWEMANLKYLKKRNQAHEIKGLNGLVKDLNKPKNIKVTAESAEPILDWKENLIGELEKISVSENRGELLVNKPFSHRRFSNLFARYFKKSLSSFKSIFKFLDFVIKKFFSMAWWGIFNRIKKWHKYS